MTKKELALRKIADLGETTREQWAALGRAGLTTMERAAVRRRIRQTTAEVCGVVAQLNIAPFGRG